MRVGFLILAHRYPNQLKELIDSLLKFPDSKIYLHIDKKSQELYNFISSVYQTESRMILLEERYSVYWGSFNQIQATFTLMKRAVESNSEEFFMLLSGQDFPIKKPIDLFNFIIENKNKQFVVNFKLPDSQWDHGGLNRMANFSFDIPNRPWLSNKMNSFISRIQNFCGIKRNPKFNQYGGSNWFNVTYEALYYMVDYVHKNPKFYSSFKYTRCADEIFVQSILMNSIFRDHVISDDLRYIDWSSGPEFPKIIRLDDFDRMVKAPTKFFARKFDISVDQNILNKLTEHLER